MALIARNSVVADIRMTSGHLHARELALSAIEEGFERIVSVGGDGTMNEVSKPLISNPEITTGIIPTGTGNDFIQILGFPDRFKEEHWDVFFQQNINSMDVVL